MLDFDTRYEVYLDWTIGEDRDWNEETDANWTRVFPDSGKLGKGLVPNELFSRKSFKQITFRNKPESYAIASNDAYRLYNIIHDVEVDQEIRIKITFPDALIDPDTTNEVRGYFGTNNCKFDHDKKIVKVTPTILDQYTYVLENADTEVSIFGDTDLKTSRWDLPTDYATTYPSGIDETHNIPLDRTAVQLGEARDVNVLSTINTGGFLTNCVDQYSLNCLVIINATLNISAGETIKFYINVYDPDDVEYSSVLLATYNEIVDGSIVDTFFLGDGFALGAVEVPRGYYVRLITEISNTGDTIDYNAAVLRILSTSLAFPTTNVEINITSEFLVHIDVLTEQLHGRADPKDSDVPALTEYFEVDGTPKDSLLEDNSRAPTSRRPSVSMWTHPDNAPLEIDGLYLPDITTALGAVLPLDSDYELSEMTIYKGTTWRRGIFGKKVRRMFLTCKYSRFEAWMPDAITPPVESAGWTAHSTITRSDGNETLWTVVPFSGATAWTLGSTDTSGGSFGGTEWVEKLTSSRLDNYPDDDTAVTLPSRSLYDVIKTIYNGTHQSLVNADVKSAFLFNDSDANITPTAGKNYFLQEFAPAFGGDENFLNNIACVHSYKFKTASENADDAELLVSLNKFLKQFKLLFNNQIFWFVDPDTNDLHIEHIYYLDLFKTKLDLTTGTAYTKNINLLPEISAWDYDTSKMYSLITFDMINAGFKDFTDNEITFKKIISNKRGKDISLPNKIDLFTLDLRYCVQFPVDLENSIVLVNHDDNYKTIKATVPIANQAWENGNIALSNLLFNFAYEGVFTDGFINGFAKNFPVTIRSKIGKPIIIKGIYDYDFFLTAVGLGMEKSIDYNIDEETTDIKLLYRFGSDAVTDIFELMTMIDGDFDGAVSTLYDFGEV